MRRAGPRRVVCDLAPFALPLDLAAIKQANILMPQHFENPPCIGSELDRVPVDDNCVVIADAGAAQSFGHEVRLRELPFKWVPQLGFPIPTDCPGDMALLEGVQSIPIHFDQSNLRIFSVFVQPVGVDE